MAENSKIEWTDHTFNPWIGCTKVSPGCDHCYAEAREDKRLHRVMWGVGQPRHRTKTWDEPRRWNNAHAEFYAAHGRRQRVFCASLADVFDNEVPTIWRVELFALIGANENLDFLLLTKRVGNVKKLIEDAAHEARERGMHATATWLFGWLNGNAPANVWLGATIVNQEEADRDIPKLLTVPARVRFLSIEPMLGPIIKDFVPLLGSLHWVIAGGESGHGARPAHPDWFRRLRDSLRIACIPFHFKQWGEWASTWHAGIDPALAQGKPYVHVTPMCRMDGTNMSAPNYQLDRVGKKTAGRLLDGVTHDGFPSSAV